MVRELSMTITTKVENMNRYYVEIEHPLGKEEYGTFYIYMMAYDTQQIIDMIDEKVVWIEKTFE